MQSTPPEPDELVLDPYAYQPGIGSRIAGLASGQTGNDPNYVFHTDYVPVGRGHADAVIRFRGLAAREGTLVVRVHLLRQDAQPQLVLVTSERIQFNRLAQHDGELVIRFEAFNNCLYALYGSVLGDTDAQATGLQVMIRRPQAVDEHDHHTEARNSSHGRDTTRPEQLLVSTVPPTLSAPVTQVATLAQLGSREAAALAKEAGFTDAVGADVRWSLVYTMRCLEAYGVLAAGTRGLCLGSFDDPVARLLDQRGVAVDCLHNLAGEPVLLARNLVNYDFLWHAAPLGLATSGQQWMEAVEQGLKALLPGGLAVFTFGYDPTPPIDRPNGADGSGGVDRTTVERLALLMVSRNHEVAQLRLVGPFDALALTGAQAPSVAGFVMRRARVAD